MSFISDAFASPGLGAMGSNLSNIAPILLIFVIFYFLLIRPQQKKIRDHKAMLETLKRGDKVVTSGGIIGKVEKTDAEPDVVLIEIAPDVKVKVMKSTISEVLNRIVPAETAAKS